MEAPLRDQIRYLEIRLDACRTRPALHREQIQAYGEQLELARRADDGRDYLVRMHHTGTSMAIMRAEWLDRYRNLERIHRALGNDRRAGAAALCVRALQDAPPTQEFVLHAMTAQTRAAAMVRGPDESESLLTSLVTGLLDWRIAPEGPFKVEAGRAVVTTWTSMRRHDPQCTWERVSRYPPYRSRLPFDARRLDIVGAWLRRIVGDAACDEAADTSTDRAVDTAAPRALAEHDAAAITPAPGVLDVAATLPTARQAAAGYLSVLNTFDPDDPSTRTSRALYERVAEIADGARDGPAFLRAMAEEDLYPRLARAHHLDVAAAAVTRCSHRGQPHVVHHYRALERALLACKSPTEVEFEVACAEQMYAIEVAWVRILSTYATRAIAAIARYLSRKNEHAQHQVVMATRLTRRFFGKDWDHLLDTPWLSELFHQVWFARARVVAADEPDSLGARFGEVGTDILDALREASLQRMIERCIEVAERGGDNVERAQEAIRSSPIFESPEQMRAYWRQGFDDARQNETSPDIANAAESAESAEPRLRYWDREFTIDDLDEFLSEPARPEIPMIDDPST